MKINLLSICIKTTVISFKISRGDILKSGVKKVVLALSIVFAMASVSGVAASSIPAYGTTTIYPNSLTVIWEDGTRAPETINAFRIFGYNVAQLRTMVGILGGTVSDLDDGTFQIIPSGESVDFTQVGFDQQAEIEFIINNTTIRSHDGMVLNPDQPGIVFLSEYGYNWASVRDIISAMNLRLVGVVDDPENGTTEITVGEPMTNETDIVDSPDGNRSGLTLIDVIDDPENSTTEIVVGRQTVPESE